MGQESHCAIALSLQGEGWVRGLYVSQKVDLTMAHGSLRWAFARF